MSVDRTLLTATELGGHNVTSEQWQHDINTAALLITNNYREAFSTDNCYKAFVEWQNTHYLKNVITVSGSIPHSYFARLLAEDCTWGTHEVRLAVSEWQNSPLIMMPQAFPVYGYRVQGVKRGAFLDPIKIERTSLQVTPGNVMWILCYTLQLCREQVDAIFVSAAGAPLTKWWGFHESDSEGYSSPDHRSAYDYIKSVLEQYVRKKMEQADYKATSDTDHPLGAANFEAFVFAATFASHPESIRYFGASKFEDLSIAYEPSWLMGLSMESIDKLHSQASENPYSLCFPHTMPNDICATEHMYVDRMQFESRISECSLDAFFALSKKFNVVYDMPAYVELAVYAALKFHVAQANHTYIGFREMSELICADRHGLFMHRFRREIRNFSDSCFTFFGLLNALGSLHRSKCIFVYSPEGDFGLLQQTPDAITRITELRIYLRTCYVAEAMFVSSVYQLYKRQLTAHACGIPLTTNKLSPATAQKLCSEQVHVISNLEKSPVINVFGPGGAGKTYLLTALHELFDNEILYLAWQNPHVSNLAKHFRGRCSTIHKIFARHPNFCQKTINDFTRECGTYKALQNILQSRRAEEIRENAGLQQEEQGDEERVWCKCTSCPFENLKVVCFEEVSTIDLQLCSSVLWLLLRCAPNLRLAVFAGDHRQLPSIGFGNLIQDLSVGLGMYEFRHTHRARAVSLRRNAELLVQRQQPIAFDQCMDGETESHVTFRPCLNDPDQLRSCVEDLILERGLTLTNSQFITRMNEVRWMCSTHIRNVSLGLDPETKGGVYPGQKIMYSHGSLGCVKARELRIAWCVVFVRLEEAAPVGGSSKLSELYAKTSEIVSASRLLDPADGERPKNVRQIIGCMSSGELQAPDALDVVVNTADYRRRLLDQHCIPMHFELIRVLRNAIPKKSRADLSRMVDIKCLRARFIELKHNTTQQPINSEAQAQRVIACFALDSPNATDLPEVSFEKLRELILANEVQLMPYAGGERGNVTDASVRTVSAMQGASASTIIDIKLKPSKYETLECLYTGFTRAEDDYIGVGNLEAFVKAARNKEPIRNSVMHMVLANIKRAFGGDKLQPELSKSALVELLESDDPNNQHFAYLTAHPATFMRAYAKNQGIPNKLVRIKAHLRQELDTIGITQFYSDIGPMSCIAQCATTPSDNDQDRYFDDADDTLFMQMSDSCRENDSTLQKNADAYERFLDDVVQ